MSRVLFSPSLYLLPTKFMKSLIPFTCLGVDSVEPFVGVLQSINYSLFSFQIKQVGIAVHQKTLIKK